MASQQLGEERIFNVARRMPDPDARAEYLDQVCGGNLVLRTRVEALLGAHAEDGFMESPPHEPAVTIDQPVSERPGAVIGYYKLMEQIGEGGMGVVFVAEQERPMRRRVALKIIKPGMDTKEVIARFEAERQALALMDHPNIAKVLDAGSTESGRPYFVMELVRGIPITEYCDGNKLPIRERLELFVAVCQAIQHAHQKGIIHRDVKPSNVLVTLHDGKPVPKVIDFGVAKAISQRLTERTIYTRFAQAVGTPLYMSPEQAEMSGLDVDTRSDVYSLGVLLYELLTGTTPFDKQTLEKAAYDEVRRIIREQDPPKPSTKIGTLGEKATSVSAHRGTDPRSLSKFVMGDLDIIAMKALEKDRTRRYDTASGLAADVQRFLKDEPIVARSPSLAYRFTKFAHRNRVAMATSALVLALLILGIVATSWMARNLMIEVKQKEQTLQMFAEASYEEAVTAALAGDQEKAQNALDVAERTGVSRSRVVVLKGLMALNEGMYDDAIELAEQALEDESLAQGPEAVGAHALLAVACIWAGYDDRWERALHQLRQLTPRSDTDHLLKAYPLVQFDPLEAMPLLAKRPGIQRSPVGLCIRGIANYGKGVDRQDAKLLDAAAEDFKYVQFLFHDSQGSVAWRVEALAAAVGLARREGRHEDARRFAEEGRPLAERLAAVANFPGGDYDRWMFYLAVGDSEEASRAIRDVGRHPGTYSWFLAADCLRRHGSAAAAEAFDKAIAVQHKQSKYVRLAKAYLVCDLPDGPRQVQKLVGDMLDDPSPLMCRYALLALCPACKPSEIQERARKATSAIWEESNAVGSLLGGAACVTYLAGQLEEPKFLEGASGHGYSKAMAHFTVAMMRLAAGKRDAAHEHFKMCVATNTIGSFDYEWARAFLARMDADPTWPSWLREKEGQ